jgi:alpha-tubulin suppressor-like RCC1 family protein
MIRTITAAAIVAGLIPVGAQAASPSSPAFPAWWGTVFSAPQSMQEDSPTAATIPGTVVQLGSSNSTGYALTATGQVYAWGLGGQGQLGDGVEENSATPVQVEFPAGVTIAQLATDAMPYNAALAIDSTGHAWGWGYAATGALCSQGTEYDLTPVQLSFVAPVTLIAGASAHTIADSGGSLVACGSYQYGSLGTGTKAAAYAPTPVVGMSGVDAVAVYASSIDSGVLLANGQVWDWGSNDLGQLGDGQSMTSITESDVPVQVPLKAAAVQAALGGSLTTNGHALVALADGTYWAWGDDHYGELGDGRTTNEASPVEFIPPAGVTYATLDASGGTSYAIDQAGDVWAWGEGNDGQIGNGGKATAQRTPVEVVSGGAGLISATAHAVVVGA